MEYTNKICKTAHAAMAEEKGMCCLVMHTSWCGHPRSGLEEGQCGCRRVGEWGAGFGVVVVCDERGGLNVVMWYEQLQNGGLVLPKSRLFLRGLKWRRSKNSQRR